MKTTTEKLKGIIVFAATFLCAVVCVRANNPPPLMVAYFIPSDRQPIPGYVERMDRVLQEVQSFYRQSMISNGYGPLTFTLDRDGDGKLKTYQVHGKKPAAEYDNMKINNGHNNLAGLIRDEVKAALTAQGINPDSQVL